MRSNETKRAEAPADLIAAAREFIENLGDGTDYAYPTEMARFAKEQRIEAVDELVQEVGKQGQWKRTSGGLMDIVRSVAEEMKRK